MWLVGLVVVALAVAGFFWMRRTRSELHAMIGTETSTIDELEELRRISDELGARGGFRRTAEVVGAAHPRPEGLLTAALSEAPCVWYRYQVERIYEQVEQRDGRTRRVRKTETVSEHTSEEGYALIDEQGRTIGIAPAGTKPEGVEQSVERFEPHNGGGGGFGFQLGGFSFGNRSSTIGMRYKEWLIRPGTRLYALGEVHDAIGPLVLGKPQEKGHFIIAAKTEQQLREERTKRHRLLAIGVPVAFVAGAALTIFDLVR
ncbi:E3 ubiquitin ligase family protein [Saccharopolyspora sp. 7B]|uniref:E3 ubiquitin ligase family protein n=1 Tax=Saccharopolyspora sp. 7B TaxID=2877240 RepID=UPI001CD72A9D|nr:E3 ubiquitin ligase family protein [Saccharopolyspora sp. 7B]MCA1278322.1 E3 ubiquitin ligase family protein [Saccharopolyspora sp. 7B]